MALGGALFFLLIAISATVSVSIGSLLGLESNTLLSRSSFPAGFIFGTSSSAYQVEGAVRDGGRGASIWDTFTHDHPENIADRSNGDVAEDQYHRYKGFQKGKIGISLSSNWYLPFSDAKPDKDAVQRIIDFMYGWFMDPLTEGNYPIRMREIIGDRLPKFTKKQSEMVKGSFDFIGLNYNTTNYASNLPYSNNVNVSYSTYYRVKLTGIRKRKLIGGETGIITFYSYPQGLTDLLLYTKTRYNNPTIYITENGIAERDNKTASVEEALKDDKRIQFYRKHLLHLQRAISEGVDVKGYFAWSVLDDFEWAKGYTIRFGICYVDYKDGLKRYPKSSALWFQKFLKT